MRCAKLRNALRCVPGPQIVQYFSAKAPAAAVERALGVCWGLVGRAYPAYEAGVIRSSDAGGGCDSDGEEIDFEGLVEQLFELLLLLAGSSRWRPMLAGSVLELTQLTLGYMQMTAAQEEAWEQARLLSASSQPACCSRELMRCSPQTDAVFTAN